MERSKELSFSVRNSGEGIQQAGLVGSTPGFVSDLQLLAGEELEARLQIHERIGGGSSARVYRGTLDGTTAVAVKVLHPHAAQRESTLQEFFREAQVLARLLNKYIVRLHALAHLPPNFGGLPTRRFTWGIITEYMEAGTLTKLVQEAARVYKQQQRIKQQLTAAAVPSVGGASSVTQERSNSLRNLRPTLSFLRRRSLTPAGDGPGPPSPRNRGAASPVVVGAIMSSPSGTAANAGGGMSAARLDSIVQEMPQLPYTDREALQWCMEVALALQFLHAQTPPVVHRDVKTDNVLMALLPLPPLGTPSAPTVSGMRGVASGDVGPAVLAASAATGTSFTAGGGSALHSSHGSLARRVLSVRAAAAAALAAESAPSRQGSMTGMPIRFGGGRPLTAKLCDFGLHVVLDLSRPVVTMRRRSYEHSYAAESLGMGGGGGPGLSLPYSNSLTRRSTRHSPADLPTGVPAAALLPSASMAACGGPMGPPSPLTAFQTVSGGVHAYSGQLSGQALGKTSVGRYEAMSRRSSIMSNRAAEENGLFRRAVSRDGDSFSRTQLGVHRKGSSVSHADSLDQAAQHPIPGGQLLAAIASGGGSGSGGSNVRGSGPTAASGGSGIFSSSPPKPGPFAGSVAAAVAAAAAAFGSSAGVVGGGIGRMSSGALVPVVGLRGSGGGTYRSPKSSGPGTGPGPPKWSGGSIVGGFQHAGSSGFAATRASLDLLLQGRMSATAAVAAASQSGASTHSVMIGTGGGGSVTGVTGGGSVVGLTGGGSVAGGGGGGAGGLTAPLPPTSPSQTRGGAALETSSASQMMLQLNGSSNTCMLERMSRLRQSHAGPGTGDLGLGAGMPLEAALRFGNRSSSGRPSAAVLLAAGGSGTGTDTGLYGSAGSAGNVGERLGSGTAGNALRVPRPSGSSPATSSRGGTRLRSNPTQVEKYLAGLEEDLQLDIASRSSSKAQVDMDPLYAPASRVGSQTANVNHPRIEAPNGLVVCPGSGIGLVPGIPSSRNILPPSLISHSGMPESSATPQQLLAQKQQEQEQQQQQQQQHAEPKSVISSASTTNQHTTCDAKAARLIPPGGDGIAVALASDRLQASGSGSGAGSAVPAVGGRISSVAPHSPSSPGMNVASTNSTQSEQGMIVLTGISCSGFGDQTGNGGGGGGAAPAAPAAVTGFIAAGLRSLAKLARGPNPMKCSSQPTMSVSSNAGNYPHCGVPLPGRGPNPTKSSSLPAMSVSGPAASSVDSVPTAAAAPPRWPLPATSAGQLPMRGGGSGNGGGGGASSGMPLLAAVQSPARGPNPVKSSSQPAMSITAMAALAACSSAGMGSSGRGRDVSTSTAAVAATGLARTTSHGSRVMSHLNNVAASAVLAPSSPTGSIHAMDLSPPVARIRSTRMGQGHLQAGPAATAAGTNTTGSAVLDASEGDLLQRDNSGSALLNPGYSSVLALRRHRHPLEVALPVDSAADLPSSASGSALPARMFSPPGGSRAGSGGGDGGTSSGSAAVVAGRHWVATVTAAASPRTHNPAGTTNPGQLIAINSGGTDSSTLPMPPPISHAQNAAIVVINRELHKVVKRLRPDGGSSFTGSGSSPLGLPPTVPVQHGSVGGAVSGAGDAGSFSYSRRSSMDSHTPSYQSIGSSRSATAGAAASSIVVHGGGASGGGHPGGLPTLHREKLLVGRSLVPGTSSAGHNSGVLGASGSGAVGCAGGAGGLAHSGPMLSGGLTSDPNSPIGSYGPAGSGVFLGRAPVGALRHHPMGPGSSLMGHMTGSGIATATASGPTLPRTTSGGVSASGNSGRQSSAGERSARQSSLVRHSSSTHSWGDYGATSGGTAPTAAAVAHVLANSAVSGVMSPSRANTGGSLRTLGQTGPSNAATAPSTAGASGQTLSALASPMLAHVTGAGSQTSSAVASVGPQRMISESAASSTQGGWVGREEEASAQGDPAYALTGRAGTLLYMAPEVIRHEPYNEKVDVFSFGVVLYEVFGRVLLLELYSRDELEALSSRIAHGFRHSRPDCMPQAIWDLVQQCWAQNPADRPTMPLVVRQMELALEAMDEAEAAAAAAAATHSGIQRVGSLFGDGGVSGGILPLGSPMLTGPGTGPGSAATGVKDRSSGRSLASHKSLLSLGLCVPACSGSLGRRSKGGLLSFRRRAQHPRSPPQPTAPMPGRPLPLPANLSSQLHPSGSGGGGGGGASSPLEFPRPPSSGSTLQSPASRGSVSAGAAGQGLDSPFSDRVKQPRCACGCIIC